MVDTQLNLKSVVPQVFNFDTSKKTPREKVGNLGTSWESMGKCYEKMGDIWGRYRRKVRKKTSPERWERWEHHQYMEAEQKTSPD